MARSDGHFTGDGFRPYSAEGYKPITEGYQPEGKNGQRIQKGYAPPNAGSNSSQRPPPPSGGSSAAKPTKK